jgi:sec-independent protein translocase protein TatA
VSPSWELSDHGRSKADSKGRGRFATGGARLRRKETTMPFGLGMGELVMILVIVTVVFGATKLPALGDGLGKAIRNFKRSIESSHDDPPAKGKIEDTTKPE